MGQLKQGQYNYKYKSLQSCLSMWATNSLQQLKTQVLKAKSYKSKPKDAQLYMVAFEKYFNSVRHASNCQKVIEYFVQIFVACLHLNPHQKINQVFKKLIYWLSEDKSSKVLYFLVKIVVEISERQFGDYFDTGPNSEMNKKADKSKQRQKQKEKERQSSRSKSRQRQKDKIQNIQKQRKQKQKQRDPEIIKSNLKALLTLVRKSGQKNLFNQDIYQVFLGYYLQRIQKQIEELYHLQTNPKTSQNNKKIHLGSFILSELSSLLANRNKPLVITGIKRYLQLAKQNNLSACISIYLLLQFKNIPNLLTPILFATNIQGNKLPYHQWINTLLFNYMQNYIKGDNNRRKINSLVVFIVQKFYQILGFCIKNGMFEAFSLLYKFYPLNYVVEINNSEQLLDRTFIHLSLHKNQFNFRKQKLSIEWQEWKKQFITSHIQYIQCTKMSALTGKFQNKNILDIQYVIKLYILSIQYLNPELLNHQNIQQLRKQFESIFSILRKQLKGNKKDHTQQNKEVSNFFQALWMLCLDYISISYSGTLFKHNPNNNTQKFSFSERLQNNNPLYNTDKLTKNKQQEQICVKYIKQLSQNLQNKSQEQKILVKITQNLQQQHNTNHLLFQRWKIYMHSMFLLTVASLKQNSSRNRSNKGLQYYSKEALHAMHVLSIKPGIIVRQQQPETYEICKLSKLSLACLQILDIIVNNIEKDEIIGQIKRLMSESFDRVDQQIIRDMIVKDIFLSRCLIMTNHAPKCKFMMDLILRSGQIPKNKNILQLHKYLQRLLKNVPRQIIPQYCRYITNKDKLQLRLALYQKKLTQLQYLIQLNLYDVVARSKPMQVNQQPMVLRL